MLDGIRANAQSWGVKLAFGIIIIVFVFWGIGASTGPTGIVATVNGKNITELEFRRAYAQLEQNIKSSFPDMTPEMLQSLGLEQQVLQSLVVRKLIEAEAARTGIDVSPYDLRRAIEVLPYFQDKNGKFDADLYLSTLKDAGRSASQFEDDIRQDLLPQKFQTLMTAGAYASPETARRIFDYQQEQRKVNYVLFPAEKHRADAAPTDADIDKAYQERAQLYAVPPRIRLEYVALNPAEMGDASAITDEAVVAAYEARLAQFSLPERVRARHILITVPENAAPAEVKKAEDTVKAIEARIRGGEDFAAVARETGQDGTAADGGDLGWFARTQMVPQFADAAFALKPGEMSGPVRSPFGFHLIKVEEHQAAATRPLEDVKEELRAALATEEASQGLQDKADAVLATAMGGKSMADAAVSAGLTAKDTGLVTADELGKVLGLRASDVQTVMGTPAGGVVDTALAADGGLLVVRVAESLPQMTRPLDEVREELVATLTREKARKLAQDEAEQARKAFADGKPGGELAAEVVLSEPFGRQGYVPGLGMGMDLVQTVFALPAKTAGNGTWLDKAFTVDDGAVLVSLAEVTPPDDAVWQAASAMQEQQMRSDRASMMFQAYLFQLNKDAKIRILNTSLFDHQTAPQS